MSFLRKLWEGWKRVGQAIGDFVARVVLTIFYFTLFMPFGLVMRLFKDPLHIRQHTSGWLERSTRDLEIDDARKLS